MFPLETRALSKALSPASLHSEAPGLCFQITCLTSSHAVLLAFNRQRSESVFSYQFLLLVPLVLTMAPSTAVYVICSAGTEWKCGAPSPKSLKCRFQMQASSLLPRHCPHPTFTKISSGSPLKCFTSVPSFPFQLLCLKSHPTTL